MPRRTCNTQTPQYWWSSIRWCSHFGNFLKFLKVKYHLLYNLRTPLLGIYTKIEPQVYKKLSATMFVAVSSIVTQTYKQPRFPSRNQSTVIHSYSGLLPNNGGKRNHWYRQQYGWISKILCWVKKKKKPGINRTYCMIPFLQNSRVCKIRWKPAPGGRGNWQEGGMGMMPLAFTFIITDWKVYLVTEHSTACKLYLD